MQRPNIGVAAAVETLVGSHLHRGGFPEGVARIHLLLSVGLRIYLVVVAGDGGQQITTTSCDADYAM